MRFSYPESIELFPVNVRDKIDDDIRLSTFHEYTTRVVVYQRSCGYISDNLAKGILKMCAALIYNPKATDNELDEFAEKTAREYNVDLDDLIDEFTNFWEDQLESGV